MHTNDVFVIRLKLFHWNNKKQSILFIFMQICQMAIILFDMKLTYIYATLYAGP